MPTTELPDNGHAASQKIGLKKPTTRLETEGGTSGLSAPHPASPSRTVVLHQQIHDALETDAFKEDAAGKSGEDLRLAVAAAVSSGNVLVEIISVGLADAAEAYSATPYEAIWTTAPDAATERSYFGV